MREGRNSTTEKIALSRIQANVKEESQKRTSRRTGGPEGGTLGRGNGSIYAASIFERTVAWALLLA